MLNNYINIDLHVHSYASRHKESPIPGYEKSPVQDSTENNLDNLFSKLEEYKIALFAFTDHNVFSASLYRAAKAKIQGNKASYEAKHPELKDVNYNGYCDLYPREVLPGVEFDVKRPNEEKSGHVLVIFDPLKDSDIDKIQKNVFSDDDLDQATSSKAEKGGEKDPLKEKKMAIAKKDFYYEWADFEALLKTIGCSAVIIGEQRSEILGSGHTGRGHADIIDAKDDEATKIATLGAISAIECSSPRNESVILRDLKTLGIPENKSLFIGSDCHDWKAYPYHHRALDKNGNLISRSPEKPGFPTCVKALPNFKGLLMCITSPKTRFIPEQSSCSPFIHWIVINGQRIPLSPGINTIVGENGSGKTFVLRSIYDDKKTLKKEYKSFFEHNTIDRDGSFSSAITSITQGELSDDLKEYGTGVIKALKKENDIGDYDNTAFENAFTNYTNSIINRFKAQIDLHNNLSKLPSLSLTLENHDNEQPTNFISVTYASDFQSSINRFKTAYDEIGKIKVAFDGVPGETKSILHELGSDAEERYKTAENNIHDLLDLLKKKQEEKQSEIIIKGFIKTAIDGYDSSVEELLNAPQKASKAYGEKKENFVNLICLACKEVATLPDFPSFPPIMTSGIKEGNYGDIKLVKSAQYYNVDLSPAYFGEMFMSGKGNETEWAKVESVSTGEKIIKQLTGASTIDDIKDGMQANLKRFFSKMEVSREEILDTSDSTKQSEGATPGQQSLNFFKCLVATDDGNPVIVIDQPEDNISPKNIAKFLSKYLADLSHSPKSKHQVIIVTHNPYLVVNSDSDNVICLESYNQVIKCRAGCLEDDENNIMQFIANNMDGGKQAIEDRLNYYTEVINDEESHI